MAVARLAGMYVATSATSVRMPATTAKANGSLAFTPNNRLASTRVRPYASSEAEHDAEAGERHALSQDDPQHPAAVGPERHADADFLRPLIDRVRHQPVDADRGQHQRDAREDAQQHHVEVLPRDGAGQHLVIVRSREIGI